ncbi:MAG: hypothetical protein KKG33_06580 [candidate division Zixibacteria bacterium]|nr:hypothetical protein [candidate division Zixibacteria bacterium]MBU1470202.1 hypothetical protein [candidate division Zixibacteria bacterium]MBU2625209.1 hypothetical protein [candidate division Zixibacteria bacterium]
MSRVFGTALSLLMALLMLSFLGCEGDQGPQGSQGAQGDDGADGRDASTDPPGDMIFGLAITNNSEFNQNGNTKIRLTFDQSAEPSEDVVVCYKLDKPPVIDGQDQGIEDWGSDEFTISSIPLTNLRGIDNRISFADIRAGYDDKYIYFMVSWQEIVDASQGLAATADWFPGRWRLQVIGRDSTWSRQPVTEDQMYLFWDISGVDGWAANGSDLLYHDDDSTLYLSGSGLVDVWHWKAGRTGLIGYFDDEYITGATPSVQDDHGSAGYVDNVFDSLPRWMHKDGILAAGEDISPPFQLWNTVPFNVSLKWPNNATIIGFVSVMPTGGRADIECSGKDSWNPGAGDRWTMEFRRLRNTGHGDDVKF